MIPNLVTARIPIPLFRKRPELESIIKRKVISVKQIGLKMYGVIGLKIVLCLKAGMENSGGEDTGMTNLKRRRKPSEKVMELQAQKVRKPVPKPKSGSSGKSLKTKSRIGIGIGIEQEDDMNHFGGDDYGIDD